MKKLFLLFAAAPLFFGGCDKCEIDTPVTIYVDFDVYQPAITFIPETSYLDGYDTSRLRQAAGHSYDFLWNEVKVTPADSSLAQYIMTIRSVKVSETSHEDHETENCYEHEDEGWLWTIIDPPDEYTFRVDGIWAEMQAEVLDTKTGKIYYYTGTGGGQDLVTTSPPPGADTTGNPCFEWREEPLSLSGSAGHDYADGAIMGAAANIFYQFKCDVAKAQHQ